MVGAATGLRKIVAKPALVLAAGATLATLAAGAQARVARIVIDTQVSPAFNGASFGSAGPYETIAGRAFGELDPNDPHNAIIQDIKLAPRNARGMVEYTASFQLVKPIDMSKSSRLMWHDVPNRSGRVTIGPLERASGDIGLSSGWQGDNSGQTVPRANNDTVIVPVAKNPDGSPITGQVMGRILNAAGANSQPMIVHSNPLPYRPVTLDTKQATLTTHASESIDGVIGASADIAPGDWAFAKCSAENLFPGTPDPTQICLKNGFDPKLLYQVMFTTQDPLVLGIGFAAFRDMASFFRNAAQDDVGTPNPVANGVNWAITRGRSQSGNFIRGFIHLGFNQDEAGRQVYDGAWPIIAGRRIALNIRFAMPDGVLKLYEPGSEGPQWWTPWPDKVRGLPAAGILDRCSASHTCPKIIEHFGSAEVWGLKLTPEWVGTAGDADIPLRDNVRRYYIPGTQHGGGKGGFSTVALTPPACPSSGYGQGLLADNPVPHTETVNAIQVHFRHWVMKGVAPPANRYPNLANGTLVDATSAAMGFPALAGLPPGTPTGLVNPVLDYDFGPDYNPMDGSGFQTVVPPRIKHVIAMKVPKVDADGNELGGVPVVLRDAPLGTYLGWNITAAGFHKGQICNYAGGMIPFAKTKAERLANEDPRPSLEERYTNHAGYVAAVEAAARRAVAEGFLLEADSKALVAAAGASDVLK
ncbi:MAG TPA: alpha/beta hydrolase domain-containing protein [Xanthobacteraceae bacterium]